MLVIDFIGFIITMFIVGLRYPQYVLVAALVHEIGQVVMAIFLHGKIDLIVAAGAFSITQVSNLALYNGLLIAFSGSLANYVVASTFGGIDKESSASLFNPVSKLQYPFTVINLRLAFVSLLFNIIHIL